MEKQSLILKYEEFELNLGTYIQKKSDEWILCLHGIQSNSELFEKLIQRPFFKQYSILCIDDVGFGISSKPEDFSYDLQDQMNIIQMVLEKFDIHKVHIIGHSLGGMIGTLILESIREKILSFINMEGNLVLSDAGLSKTVASYAFDDFKNIQYDKIKSDLALSQERSATDRRKWLEQIPDFAFYKTSQSIIEWSRSGKLLEIFVDSPVKKLFLYGDKNKKKTEILPTSIQRIEISGSGHFMLHDNFNETSEAIESFLNKLG